MTVGLVSFASTFPSATFSQRSVISLDFLPSGGGIVAQNYAFINHMLAANLAPIGTVAGFNQGLDANGWPTHALTAATFGGTFYIPDSQNWPAGTGGWYIIAGKGSGTFFFNNGTPWSNKSTTPPAVGSITVNSGSNYTIVDTNGAGWQIAVNFTGDGTGNPQAIQWRVSGTDQNNNGQNLRSLQVYRSTDATDLGAGKIFRSDFKQDLVNLCPAAIRFLNWHSPIAQIVTRWENRILPSNATYQSGWTSSLAYGAATDAGGINQFTVAGVGSTPASMTHGEIATVQFSTGLVRCAGNSSTSNNVLITGVTLANPGQVTTNNAHGFLTGDKILHSIAATDGMPQLNLVVATITKVDATNYTLGIDTTGFTAYTNTSGTSYANQNVTLQVGSGSNRTAYPVMFSGAVFNGSSYGNNYLVANAYNTFVFDAYLTGNNGVQGVWLFNNAAGSGNPPTPMGIFSTLVPVEICTQLVNEVNALSVSQGKTQPIHMWINMPTFGLSSLDSSTFGYSSASNYAVKAVDAILNGANGYAGLSGSLNLFVENSNETWNSGGSFLETPFYQQRGIARWGAGGSSIDGFSTLKAMVVANDVLGGGFNNNRIKHVLGLWGSLGYTSHNVTRITGNSFVNTDASNPLFGNVGAALYPINMFVGVCYASYTDPSSTWINANLATMTAQWQADAGNAVAQEADCAAYVAGWTEIVLPGTLNTASKTVSMASTAGIVVGNFVFAAAGIPGSTTVTAINPNVSVTLSAFPTANGLQQIAFCTGAGTQSTAYYTTVLIQLSTNIAALGLGKVILQYEGNTDLASVSGSFTLACKRSQAWATGYINYINSLASYSNFAMPAIYNQMGAQFGMTTPDGYGVNNGGTAGFYGSGYSLLWNQLGTRNQALA